MFLSAAAFVLSLFVSLFCVFICLLFYLFTSNNKRHCYQEGVARGTANDVASGVRGGVCCD